MATLLRELVYSSKILNNKIKEIEDILEYSFSEELINSLFGFIDEKQNLDISINKINNEHKVEFNGSEISIANLLLMKDSITKKIKILTDLINSGSDKLDKLNLIKQRDKYYDELFIIDYYVLSSDINVGIDSK